MTLQAEVTEEKKMAHLLAFGKTTVRWFSQIQKLNAQASEK